MALNRCVSFYEITDGDKQERGSRTIFMQIYMAREGGEYKAVGTFDGVEIFE